MDKKIVTRILGFALIAVLLSGCIGNNGSGVRFQYTNEADDIIELVLWSIATENDAFHQSYLRAIAAFEEANPGVRIRFETFDNESYKTKIRLAVATNELPDIFFVWGGGFSRPFVESGKVLALDGFYAYYAEQLPRMVLENVIFDELLYGSVMTIPISVTFYNRSIFAQYGLEVPTTWEEFIKVCQVLIENDISPMGTSGKDLWVLAMMFDGLALKSVGAERLRQVLLKEEGSFTEEEFLEAALKFRELVEMGVFYERAHALSNDEASARFYDGEVAMFTTGSWMVGSIQTDADNPSDFGAFPIPVINGENAGLMDFMGGASDALMVSAGSEHPELAAQATFELTRSISKYAYLDGAAVPAWRIDFDDGEISPLGKQIVAYVTNATSLTLWFDIMLEAEHANSYLALLNELFIGTVSPEEFVTKMADALVVGE
ncbi:MAG: extracellular solute-binding protein [Lachnospiraceae bacterium]|nr:extracellular solute-binding protein [Lachnospiraceae bacterium]